jgi:hypothetical protein
MPESFDAEEIAEELNDCRQRGLDWLDRSTTNQKPVRPAMLERLAEDYAAIRQLGATGRIGQIKTLLRDGIAAFARQGHRSDADLLRDLFFGESMDGPIGPPGVLLRRAQDRFGDSTESRFRERRTNVMRSFGLFLITFVVRPDAEAGAAGDQRQQLATTGYVAGSERFIQHLANAVEVTIVGITNERLPRMLGEALRRKRDEGGPDAFWRSLRIVFLGKALLDALNDEREDFQDTEALGLRRQEAVWARRSVWDLLKRAHATRWAMFECPYLPVLNGAFLEFKDGKKVAHLVIRRPRRASAEHVFIEVDDLDDRFKAVFEDIIHDSDSANMIVPVGFPADSTFHYRGARNQINVLDDRSGADGWLPMVLVITPKRIGDRTDAMLQLRTPANSARELSRLSHLAGHVLQDDRLRPAGRTLGTPPTSFSLTDETPLSAAQRVVQEVSAQDLAAAIRPVTTGRYLYPDKEHLFFFVFVLDLPQGIQFPRRAEMHTFSLAELIAVRANQVLRSAAELCRTTDISGRAWTAAAEVVALNLYLHDQAEMGQRLLEVAGDSSTECASMASAIDQMVTVRTSPSLVEPGREIHIAGLAGWQHREFFSVLLGLYADIGISGARELVEQIKRDRHKSDALRRLAELYGDEDIMTSMPMEL